MRKKEDLKNLRSFMKPVEYQELEKHGKKYIEAKRIKEKELEREREKQNEEREERAKAE